MKKIPLFTICLSSFMLFACSDDDTTSVSDNRSETSPVEIVSISGPKYSEFIITVAARDNNVIINDMVVNRGNCELNFKHDGLSNSERIALTEQSGLETNSYGSVKDVFKWYQFLKETTHKNTFPVALDFAQEKKFYYYCKNDSPIIEVSVKT